MEARNLRLLVIDDRRSSLADDFPNIDPVWLPRFDEDESILCLESWEQMLELLACGNSFPEFDLLAIDVRFDADRSNLDIAFSPYAGETEGISAQNPFGLLYGLVIAALTRNRPTPFAFKEYSGDGASVKNDTVAVTACGMLLAIQRGRFWEGGNYRTPRQFVSSHLSDLPNMMSRNLLHELLSGPSGFRARLLDFVKKNGGVDRAGNLEYLIELARTATSSSIAKLREEGVVMCLSTHAEKIRVQSLFADLENIENNSVKSTILPYLETLLDSFNQNHDRTFEATITCVELLQSDKMPLNDAIRATCSAIGITEMPTTPDLVLSVVLCLTLICYHDSKGLFPRALRDSILEKLVVAPASQNLVDRYLREASGNLPKSLGALLKHLERANPIPVRYADCCNKFWLMLEYGQIESSPGFLRASLEDRQWKTN